MGLNWQQVRPNVAFVGVTDSLGERTTRPCAAAGASARPVAVDVHIFASELEGAVVRT
jgi:hypothetical protein